MSTTTNLNNVVEDPPGIVRTREGLLATLCAIDEEGWDGPTGRALLAYVRTDVVRPQVGAIGLRGPAGEQAEATGWEAVWEALAAPAIRRARSPWGVLWTTARRAILGEFVADTYGARVRTAWRRARRDIGSLPSGRLPTFDEPGGRHDHAAVRAVSLTALTDLGWEPAARDLVAGPELGPLLTRVVGLLVEVGWRRSVSEWVVEVVAAGADAGTSSAARGWRNLAEWCGLPPWQVRRVTVLLTGAPGWPGLIERLVRDGPEAVEDPGVIAAARSTVDCWSCSPKLAARRAEAAVSQVGQRVAWKTGAA